MAYEKIKKKDEVDDQDKHSNAMLMKFEVEFKLLERWYKEPNITTIDVNVDDEKEYLM